jgi:HAD superfamily hydrolase (TIGR01490 family)
MTRTVAAFDVDGTLTRRDTLLPFLASVVGWPRVLTALGVHARDLARDRDVAKEQVLTKLLAGVPDERLRGLGAEYAQRVRIEPGMRDRVRWHREQGHEVVLVSASLDLYLTEVGERLGVDRVLCTSLEYADDACTGRLVGGNCRGAEKAARLRAYLSESGDDGVTLWAYGDSSGDTEMLAMADHPVRVKRARIRSGTAT